jgi:endonuclease/exonuclease/phosphatase family metal-dependent hydrolase
MELKLYKEQGLVAIVLVCHLKSHRGPDNGIDKRYEEVKVICGLYNTLKEENPNTPIIWMGDFNGNAVKGENQFEFDNIYYNTDLIDSLEQVNFPMEKRFTHIGFNDGKTSNIQLDYMFISTQFHNRIVESSIFFYRDENGDILVPKNYEQRRLFGASDHLPVVLEIKE